MSDGAGERENAREAMRRRVCPLCLDGGEDGACQLEAERPCPLDTHLEQIIDTVLSLRSRRIDDYREAVEREVCGPCQARAGDAGCRPRERGECSLGLYLPLVIEAIEDVTGRSLVDW